MREILFRGFSTDSSEWVEGCLLQTKCHTYIAIDKVDPATVGQFTGLTDKNGKKIFEGDILLNTFYTQPFAGVVKFGKHNPNDMEISDYSIGFFIDWKENILRNDLCSWIEKDAVEVIGNIHDNPELLEVSDGN